MIRALNVPEHNVHNLNASNRNASNRNDPDADGARDLLQRELSKPEYNSPQGWLSRLIDWVNDRLSSLLNVVPGSGWLSVLVVILVVAIVVVAIVFAVRHRLRDKSLSRTSGGTVLDDKNLTAAQYRDRARQAASSADWDTCLLDSFRALTASAGERTLLDDAPTRTAHEVADRLAVTFADSAADLRWSADAFDRVRYGEISCSRGDAERVRDLDRTVEKAKPAAAWSAV